MLTRATPPSSAAVQASSFGSMPPLALAGGCEAEICASTAPCSSSTPGTSERKTSSSAASAVAMAAAVSSAFTLSIVPAASRPSGATTGTRPAASARRIASGARRDGLADEAELGHAADVDRAVGRARLRGTPAARARAQSSAETAARPSRTHASIGSSVTRRPPTKCGSTPRSRASALICGPPPCTTQTRASRAMRATTGTQSSVALPPSLTTAVRVTSCTPR